MSAPAPGEIVLPPSLFRDLGLSAIGAGATTVALQSYVEMPTATSVTLAPLVADDATASAEAGAAPAPAPPAAAESLTILRAFFGLGNEQEESAHLERLLAAAGSTDVRVSEVEARFLASRLRASRCLFFPLATGATIVVGSRQFVVTETLPAFSAVIVGADTAISVSEPRMAQSGARDAR
jgi:hypothetical protein